MNLLRKILRVLSFEMYNLIILKKHNINYGNDLLINGKIYVRNKGVCKLGDSVTINSGKKINSIGYNEKMYFTILKNAKLIIGNNVGMSNVNVFSQTKITIGNNVIIGGGTNIWDTNFHSINFSERIVDKDSNIKSLPIIIEDNVFIGANCTILKGVKIGRGSVIGASSVVGKSIPSNEIWAGNPIKFIKKCN